MLLACRVWGLGFRVWALGVRVQGLGVRVWGLGSANTGWRPRQSPVGTEITELEITVWFFLGAAP